MRRLYIVIITHTHTTQVSENGYLSIGEAPTYPGALPDFPFSGNKIVAPFAASIDTLSYGTGIIKYTDFSTFDRYGFAMTDVSSFIQSMFPNDQYFSGTRMMVAEWLNVPLSSRSVSSVLYSGTSIQWTVTIGAD